MPIAPLRGHDRRPAYGWSVSFAKAGSPSWWRCSISSGSRAGASSRSHGRSLSKVTYREVLLSCAWLLKTLPLKGAALRLGHRGSESYLGEEERQAIVQWIGAQETVSIEAVRDYVEEHYGVVYRSKQSYYDFLEAGGMSYHRSEKHNPKRDEAQILERREEIKKNWHRGGPRLSGES
jgi:transposase